MDGLMNLTVTELILALRQQEIFLYLDNDRLCCKAKSEAFSPSIRDVLIMRKPEISTFLKELSQPVSEERLNWEAEATLEADISPFFASSKVPAVSPAALLLTGATGFLGAFLLCDLVRETEAKIYCLVRAECVDGALQKLNQSLAMGGMNATDRVIPLLGDLAQPNLGLDAAQWKSVSTEVEAIYHNGTLVNFIYPYHLLKAANVSGTRAILRLACSDQLKPVHYISTISIFGDSPCSNAEGFTEDDRPSTPECLTDGYSQSKWVSEQLVEQAGERGLPVVIYRPGQICGDSQTGVWNKTDFICRMIKGYADVGSAPIEQIDLNMAPVDYISKAIVYLSGRAESQGQTFHLNSARSVSSQLLVDALRAEGFSLELVPMEKWLDRLNRTVNGLPEHPLYLLASMLEQSGLGSADVNHAPCFNRKKTARALDGSGIECPDIDQKIVQRSIVYFINSGFIKAPQRTAVDDLTADSTSSL